MKHYQLRTLFSTLSVWVAALHVSIATTLSVFAEKGTFDVSEEQFIHFCFVNCNCKHKLKLS